MMIGSAVLALAAVASTLPAATAQDSGSLQAPVEFTGQNRCGPPVTPDRGGRQTTSATDDGGEVTQERGGAWRQTAEMSDPRLEGAWYQTWESDAYVGPDDAPGPGVNVMTLRIQNEDGAWEGGAIGAGFADGTSLESPTVLNGEGAYEGYTAIMTMTPDPSGACAADFHGVIFADAPEMEPYVPE
jgi:hypothetical protein